MVRSDEADSYPSLQMEPNGVAAVAGSPAASPADLILQKQEQAKQVPAVDPEKGLFAQLTNNPFFTAVSTQQDYNSL